MNKIENIRQEIERRIKSCKTKNGFPAGTISAIRIETYEGLLAFINSLQQEQPDVDLVKAARHVYESWMGGTMDDVRRDMVELGRVLDAKKEEEK